MKLEMERTPVQDLGKYLSNHLFIKRDDLIPYSFGGNKARKAFLFFHEIDNGGNDCVVTYGSGSSNHCRVIANLCAARGLSCYIVSSLEEAKNTFNTQMIKLFGARIITVPMEKVHDTILDIISVLRSEGRDPFFIEGGGHGNIGTKAYIQCYQEILSYEEENKKHFDYIFFASGTGTTHAGLVCGKLMNNDNRRIIGISVARKNPRGRNVIIDSVCSYLGEGFEHESIESAVIFVDDYTGKGYGDTNGDIRAIIRNVIETYGIPLDPIYSGKAFFGMSDYLIKNRIQGANILFLHTGGTPLFFDMLREENTI